MKNSIVLRAGESLNFFLPQTPHLSPRRSGPQVRLVIVIIELKVHGVLDLRDTRTWGGETASVNGAGSLGLRPLFKGFEDLVMPVLDGKWWQKMAPVSF